MPIVCYNYNIVKVVLKEIPSRYPDGHKYRETGEEMSTFFIGAVGIISALFVVSFLTAVAWKQRQLHKDYGEANGALLWLKYGFKAPKLKP